MRSYFDALYGNSDLKSKIAAFIENGNFPHSSMIVGESGSGKRTLATLIAMALNCEYKRSGSHPLPCGSCNTCKRIREGNFPDVKCLKKSSGKTTIGVEEIRAFKEDMYLSATEADYKVYIFENAELLTAQAQNALLIALEEPCKNVVSILLAEHTDKILTTVKSRVQQFTLQKFTAEEISEFLLETNQNARLMKNADNAKFSGILMSSGGKIGTAYALLDEEASLENEKKRQAVISTLRAFNAKAPYATLYKSITELPASRTELKEVFESLMLALRDLIVLKRDKSAPLLFFTESEEAVDFASSFTQKRLLSLYDIVCSAYKSAEQNANVTAMLAALAAQIKNC